jgi:hypothetical protein
MDLETKLNSIYPLACKWAKDQEALILSSGIALSQRLLSHAEDVGVRDVTKVRILTVSMIPDPTDPLLQMAMRELSFVPSAMGGLTLGYGIFICTGNDGGLRLLRHELHHVAQYEERGGIDGFLQEYLSQLLEYGYENAPLEVEAQRYEIKGP